MKRFEVFSGYRQFYVADIGLEPLAPEAWTEVNVLQRHNTLKHIAALCPEGDITARIISCGLGETAPEESRSPDFEIRTGIEVLSGRIGVFGWPWELQDSYSVVAGFYDIIFKGYLINRVERQEDYYVVRIEKSEANQPGINMVEIERRGSEIASGKVKPVSGMTFLDRIAQIRKEIS